MDRKEAAEYLGVSLRTLDRLAAEGRIRKGRALKKTRPIVVFEESDLEALKSELSEVSNRHEVFRRLNAPAKETIAFRLDPYYLTRLSAKAEELNLSPGECARRFVIQTIEDTRVERFQEEVAKLREGLAHTFYTLLVMKFGVSEAEATAFVDSTIRSS